MPKLVERGETANEGRFRRQCHRLRRDDDAEIIVELIRDTACPVAGMPLAAELPDAAGLPFVETAAAADAILVTGNVRRFPEGARKGVTALGPTEFLELLRRSS